MLPRAASKTLDQILEQLMSSQPQQSVIENGELLMKQRRKEELAEEEAATSHSHSSNSFHNEEVNQSVDDSELSPERLDELNASVASVFSALSSPQPAGAFDPNMEFALVPGRLSVLSQSKKHRVRVAEILRRISEPEYLNASVLGGILRRAKAKNTGKDLREMLGAVGLQLPVGKRKAAPTSLFTPLIEGEAVQLGVDFNSICQEAFPAVQLAQTAVSNMKQAGGDVDGRIKDLKAAISVTEEFFRLMTEEQSHGPYFDSPCHPLRELDLLTHGFGSAAFSSFHSMLRRYLREQLSSLDVSSTLSPLPPKRARLSQSSQACTRPSPCPLPMQLGQPLALSQLTSNPFLIAQPLPFITSTASSPLTNDESSSSSPEQHRDSTPESTAVKPTDSSASTAVVQLIKAFEDSQTKTLMESLLKVISAGGNVNNILSQ